MENVHNHPADHSEKKGLFYTYFGDTGAAGMAFVIFIVLAICIFSFLRWG